MKTLQEVKSEMPANIQEEIDKRSQELLDTILETKKPELTPELKFYKHRGTYYKATQDGVSDNEITEVSGNTLAYMSMCLPCITKDYVVSHKTFIEFSIEGAELIRELKEQVSIIEKFLEDSKDSRLIRDIEDIGAHVYSDTCDPWNLTCYWSSGMRHRKIKYSGRIIFAYRGFPGMKFLRKYFNTKLEEINNIINLGVSWAQVGKE